MNKTSLFNLPNRTRYGASLYQDKALSNGRVTRKSMIATRASYWVIKYGRKQ